MPRRYKQGADGQPHPAFYGKLPEEFSKADTMRFMVETDLKLSGCVSADTLAALRAEGYDYKDGNLVPAGKEETMQEKVANTTPAAPIKLDFCCIGMEKNYAKILFQSIIYCLACPRS